MYLKVSLAVEQKVLEFNGHFEKLLLGAGTGSAAKSARHKRVILP